MNNNKLNKEQMVPGTKLGALLALTLALAAIFAACAPEVNITDYDWSGENDPRHNNGVNLTEPVKITATRNVSDNDADTIVSFDIVLTINPRSDVLKRGGITKEALDEFLSFRTIVPPAANASFGTLYYTLSPPITDFTIDADNIKGNVVNLKLNTTINTAQSYSDILVRIDGKNYTYDNGTRLDVDNNGRIEDIYDDEFIADKIEITGLGGGTRIRYSYYSGAGQRSFSQTLGGVISVSVEPAGTTVTTTPSNFQFIGTAETTNSNIWYFMSSNSLSSNDTAEKAYYDDWMEIMARGIKLQKLSSSADRWEDYRNAEYDSALRDSSYAAAASGQTWIVFNDVSFDHRASYRTIWTGDAYTETNGTYWGVKQRLYFNNSVAGGSTPTGAGRYTRTEVVGSVSTPINSNIIKFASSSLSADVSVHTHDSENKNVVIRVELGNYGTEQIFWSADTQALSVGDFNKSFKIAVYGGSGSASFSNTSGNLVYIGIEAIEYKDELDPRPVAPEVAGMNVAYITLDPNFAFVNSNGTHRTIAFRINDGISITNNKPGASSGTYHFGGSSNNGAFYDWFQFYGSFPL